MAQISLVPSGGTYRDLGLPEAVEEDVGGLQVVVDDVAGRLIQVGQALHDLRRDGLRLLLGQHLQSTATAAALLGPSSGAAVRRQMAS